MRHLTPEILLKAYRLGSFPMAGDRDDPVLHWLDPPLRGILPLDRFHVPRSLRKTIRRGHLRVSVDEDFAAVIHGCAAPTADRPRTWLNRELIALYCELHRRGHAHSVEIRQGSDLVGGLYGVRIGAAFFGESMFSRVSDASKVALVELAARLAAGGFELLDTQFITDHLVRFGAIDIPRAEYKRRLRTALIKPALFPTDAQLFCRGWALSGVPELAGGSGETVIAGGPPVGPGGVGPTGGGSGFSQSMTQTS